MKRPENPPAKAGIPCINPATGESLGTVGITPAEDVEQVVDRARTAALAWRRSSIRQRRRVLKHIMTHIVDHADELVDAVVQDSGKTRENAILGEILPVCNRIKWLIKYGPRYLKSEKVGSGLLLHKKARIDYVPLGVVACIIPWNYPLQNIISSLVAPLLAGNAVVVKASEEVAWSTRRFRQITDEALQKAGFSTDLVQIINGYGDTGAALVQAGVDKVLFIGSVANGRRIIEGSARNLTPVVMELGGKDPLIVCDDAHLEKAVHSALGGTFINLGQNCIAAERLIVFDGIYDRFMAALSRAAQDLRQGAPLPGGDVDVGAITSPRQVHIIDRLVQDALSKGATAIVGGQRPDGPGHFYPPTILTGLQEGMDILREEVFGPVMLVFRVRDEEEAIALANSTGFGLQSSVITRDRVRGERIAAALEAGGTCINDFGLCYMNQHLPFGGVKQSGFGRMNGRDGLRAYTNPKAVLADRFPLEVPPRLFPVGPGDYARAKHTVQLLFGSGWKTRLGALLQMLNPARSRTGVSGPEGGR